jgi:hypothetical protein
MITLPNDLSFTAISFKHSILGRIYGNGRKSQPQMLELILDIPNPLRDFEDKLKPSNFPKHGTCWWVKHPWASIIHGALVSSTGWLNPCFPLWTIYLTDPQWNLLTIYNPRCQDTKNVLSPKSFSSGSYFPNSTTASLMNIPETSQFSIPKTWVQGTNPGLLQGIRAFERDLRQRGSSRRPFPVPPRGPAAGGRLGTAPGAAGDGGGQGG